MKALEDELLRCKSELRVIQGEKERLKIERNDLKSVENLTEIFDKESVQGEKAEIVIMCVTCGYPFKNSSDLKVHAEKHKSKTAEIMLNQECGICGD